MPSVGSSVEKEELLYTTNRNIHSGEFLVKLSTSEPYDTVISFSEVYIPEKITFP